MSITDELREIAAKTERASGRCEKLYRGDLDHAADRIDERIEREYAKMPVDADGVPIRVGDTVEEVGEDPTRYTVCGVGTLQDRPAVFYGNPSKYGYADGWDFAENVCHVQPDSWERIIGDAANLVRGDNESVVELVERCRRLAGEE